MSNIPFDSLPREIILHIFEYIDDACLLQSRLVSRKWKILVDDEKLWMRRFNRFLHRPNWTDSNNYRWKSRYFYANKWIRSRALQHRIIDMKKKYIPWLQTCPEVPGTAIWLSCGSRIDRISITDRDIVQISARNRPLTDSCTLRSQGDDFCRFVVHSSGSDASSLWIAAGSRNGYVYLFHSTSGGDQWSRCFNAHSGDVHCVDLLVNESTVITGSRDRTVKVWNVPAFADGHSDLKESLVSSLDLGDRVWCLKADQKRPGVVAVGSAACWNDCPPLTMLDIERNCNLAQLGVPCKRGAGLLDLSFVSDHCVLCGGYDSVVRLWDLRMDHQCAWSCEEPYNSTIYCLASDGGHSAFVGTSHYGLIWLMDTRWHRPIQNYYVGGANRPVYSLAADTRSLYVGLDSEIWLLRCPVTNSSLLLPRTTV